MLKALFGLPLRQTTGLVESLLKLAGLDWSVPDFSTLSRHQKGLNVAIPYPLPGNTCKACVRGAPGTGALHLLIDSTGIKAEGEGEWFAKKHGPSKPRQSLPGNGLLANRERGRKVHLGIDADTLEIRATEVTGSRVGDAPMLPELLSQIPADQPIGKVSADGAYDTRACHAAIAAREASAVIPARKNARPWLETTPGAHARNEILRATRRLDRTIWRPLSAESCGCACRAMDGAVITDEAWSRQKCVALSCSGSASWRVTSTDRWPNCRSEPQS